MTKTFSTKLDAKVLGSLEHFCRKHHLKKSHFLAEIIREGLKRHEEALALAHSVRKGSEEEGRGELFTADEVERSIFGKKRAA